MRKAFVLCLEPRVLMALAAVGALVWIAAPALLAPALPLLLLAAWPAWATAILAAMLILSVLIVLPWILMWSGCLAAMGGMDGMRQMMDGVRAPMR